MYNDDEDEDALWVVEAVRKTDAPLVIMKLHWRGEDGAENESFEGTLNTAFYLSAFHPFSVSGHLKLSRFTCLDFCSLWCTLGHKVQTDAVIKDDQR